MTLAERMAQFLAGSGKPLTSREIAAGVHARHADVLQVLTQDDRFCGPLWGEERSRRAKTYRACPCALGTVENYESWAKRLAKRTDDAKDH